MADLPIDPSSGYCNKTGIYYSKRKPLYIPQDEYLSLPSFVSHQTHSGKIAYSDSATGYQITFPQLWRSVRSLAAGLAEMGIKKGDVILILSPNSVYFPIISMAIMSVGAIVTTTNPLNTAVEITKQIRGSSAVMAFVAPQMVNKLADANLPLVLISKMPGLSQEIINNGGSSGTMYLGELMTTDPSKALIVRIKQDDTAILLYSSGTTGLSKGVISTHRNC